MRIPFIIFFMKKQTNHGDAPRKKQTRLYRIWCGMKSRCRNPKFPRYPDYGGRGIVICQEWNDYIAFREWALSSGYKENLCIERNNNNGNYCPDNCKWIPLAVQARNTRNNRHLTIFDETKTVVEWSEDVRCIVPHYILNSRLHKGWDAREAITTPVKKIAKMKSRFITYKGQTLTIHAWAKKLGVKPAILYTRAYRGLSPEKILAPVRHSVPYGSRKIITE
jgi:hypothetical protein